MVRVWSYTRLKDDMHKLIVIERRKIPAQCPWWWWLESWATHAVSRHIHVPLPEPRTNLDGIIICIHQHSLDNSEYSEASLDNSEYSEASFKKSVISYSLWSGSEWDSVEGT